jgi:uncharacterized protein
MFKKFYPYEYVPNVFSIDYEKLYAKGYRGILFDIDNTLVHHGDDSNQRVDELFRYLHRIGFQTLLLSNNSEERILRFLKNIDSLYIHDADKPNPLGYKKALKLLKLPAEKTFFVGDQLFTDIYGANQVGIPSILVDFIRQPGVTSIGKKRRLEKLLLRFYSCSKSCQHRLGNIYKEESI